MKRISVVGCPGSGKTHVARALADALGAPHVELDAIRHLRDWQPIDPDEFHARVAAALEAPAWVVDGNASAVLAPVVWPRADTVVWLDLPRVQVTARVVRRSVWRAITRKRLWNGNRERLRSLLRREREHNIVLWAWTKHPEYREEYGAAMRDPAWAHARFVRLRSQEEVDRFVAAAR